MQKATIGCLIGVLLLTKVSTYSQMTDKVKKSDNGDEQGMEVPKNLVLEQDKQAYLDARKWYAEHLKPKPDSIKWFKDAKFGCFVHWGVYATAAGEWNGIAHLGYAEHLMRSQKIPLKEYKEKVVATFNPTAFDAHQWIKNAKDAGMKYFIITAKHHDGFAMYPSVYPYDIRLTKMKLDPMKQLADAAKKQGMKFGFYYSHAFDWENPNAPGNDWDYDNPGGDKLLHGGRNWWETYPEFLPRAEKYVNEKSIPQILELINNYHPDILWFDTPHKLPMYLNIKIVRAIREANPNIILNGRLAQTGNFNFGDYENSGDRASFFLPNDNLWESIPTTNESYGYNKADSVHKSPKYFVNLLESAAAKGGNILLNVGPKGDGTWDTKDEYIFSTIGKWMSVNSESIYGTTRNPLSIQPWGEVTQKGNSLYLHIFHYPINGKLIVGGLETKVSNCVLLADKKQQALVEKSIGNEDIEITLPQKQVDSISTVVKLTYSGKLRADSIRYLSTDFSNQMLVFDAKVPEMQLSYGDGKMDKEYARGWMSPKQYLVWEVRNLEDALFNFSIAYNTASKDENGSMNLKIDDRDFPFNYESTKTSKETIRIAESVKLTRGNHTIKLELKEFKGKQALQPLYLMVDPQK